MTDLEFLPKDPNDDLNDYQIRFGASLNSITSVTATLSQSAGAVPTGTWTTPGDTLPGSALTVSNPRISDDRKAVVFRAAGGVPGKKYAIRAVVQVAAGSLNRSAILPVTGL